MFRRVLIANRGVSATRVLRTLKRLGVESVAVYSAADRQSLHVLEADRAIAIGGSAPAESYLSREALLRAARQSGADAIHPGSGFLSEDPAFASACEAAGLCFVGPRPEHLEAFSFRPRARELALGQKLSVLPASTALTDPDAAQEAARRVGFPLVVKSALRGAGLRPRRARSPEELTEAFAAMTLAARQRGRDAALYLDRYVQHARLLEVQIVGDGRGRVVVLGERDGSLQRRGRRFIDEAPAPALEESARQRLHDAAQRLGESLRWRSAGTVQFLFDPVSGQQLFLDLVTHLDAGHGVTEEVFQLDLVELMLRIAAGEPRVLDRLRPRQQGVALQVRLHAEDPGRDDAPSAGLLTDLRFPASTRVDTWVERGIEVTAWYDPLLATIGMLGQTRQNSLARLSAALQSLRITGIESNLAFLRSAVAEPAFLAGLHTSRLLDDLPWRPPVVHVLESGVQSTVQDWPGRIGYAEVGVPPSGPMDEFAFRVANGLVGNDRTGSSRTTAGIECTMTGPVLRFDSDAVIAVTGAPIELTLNDEPLEMWTSHAITAGSVLRLGRIHGPGNRAYLAVAGGLDVPSHLGSRATFMLGRFGGHAGRSLRAGDVLHLAQSALSATLLSGATPPGYPRHWTLGVLIGPHAAPDFLTAADIEQLLRATWTVHFNSSRTGLRLVGPKPQWARTDGGEAGLHPSSLLEGPVACGSVQLIGDQPVISGPDAATLGNAVTPAVVARAEHWKLGQIRPGDTVEFRLLTPAAAAELYRRVEEAIAAFDAPPSLEDVLAEHPPPTGGASGLSPILGGRLGDPIPSDDRRVAVTYRQAGDDALLLEYGAGVLDLGLRVRVQAMLEALRRAGLPGLLDLTPGLRSLLVRFDPARLSRGRLQSALEKLEDELPPTGALEVASRIVHLPLTWNDSATRLAIARYQQTVRADAPWLPSNLEFIRRVNGLADTDAVKRCVFEATWLVVTRGASYLGAPLAMPVDPRHRLLAPPYAPPRKWTPENAVSLGGPGLAIHGLEGPGAGQLVGRTLQVWNRYRVTPEFEAQRPWLLRDFDQLRFYEVPEPEFASLREDFPAGRARLRIESSRFVLSRHHDFLRAEAASIQAVRQRQHIAFEDERQRWRTGGDAPEAHQEREHSTRGLRHMPEGARTIATSVAGSLWKLLKRPGEVFAPKDAMFVIESMKTEYPVLAPCAGRVLGVLVHEGASVAPGQDVLVYEPL